MNSELYDDLGRNEEEFLAQYKPRNYEKPSVSVDMIILTKTSPLKVLLIKRKNHPFIAQWAFPGGFVNMDEDIDTSAYRELKEETGVEAISLTQLHTYGKVHRDPRMRVISIAYLAQINQALEARAGDDAKQAAWFSIQKTQNDIVLTDENNNAHIRYTLIPKITCTSKDALAFDHIQMLLDALKTLE